MRNSILSYMYRYTFQLGMGPKFGPARKEENPLTADRSGTVTSTSIIARSACEASRSESSLVKMVSNLYIPYASDSVLDRKSTNLNMADGSNPFGTIETGTKIVSTLRYLTPLLIT